jgi:hypothetical protein
MTSTKRLVLLLQIVTALGSVAAAVLLLWPSSIAVASIAPTLPELTAAVPPMITEATALTDSIVNANIFSLTRKAPGERTFVAAPVDPMVAVDGTMPAGVAFDSLAVADSDPVPALYGVVNGPQGSAALLRLDPMRAGSRLYRLGEGVGGYRVRSIGADRVELDGPAGSTVLTLQTRGGTP